MRVQGDTGWGPVIGWSLRLTHAANEEQNGDGAGNGRQEDDILQRDSGKMQNCRCHQSPQQRAPIVHGPLVAKRKADALRWRGICQQGIPWCGADTFPHPVDAAHEQEHWPASHHSDERSRQIGNRVADYRQPLAPPTDEVRMPAGPEFEKARYGILIGMDRYVDVVIPRGGKGLISRVKADATVPVIMHLHGNCHVYVDADADARKALRVVLNSKAQRLGTCNTAESLLIHQERMDDLLGSIAAALQEKGIEIRACERGLPRIPGAIAATEEDYGTEYLGPIISLKVVDDLDAAIAHINRYGSQHTESIVTENYTQARRFLREVDASSVMVNASTRFADGFEYGLGAEIGISTNRLHVRGPVGLEGLTLQKWIVLGDGHIRS